MKKQLTRNREQMTANLLPTIAFPRLTVLARTVFLLLLTIGAFYVNAQVYTTTLTGAAEAPPNASPAIGTATVTINNTLNTMRIETNFSGLTGNSSAAHIHAATAVAGTGTVGVATANFPGFPFGVTSGTYDMTFDMTLTSSYNAAYLSANGGTPAGAFAALKSAIAAGKSYFNLHSTTFGGGEIRGFLRASCTSVFYAFNPATSRLVSFSAIDPSTLLSDVAITGLNAGERLTGLDYRPADGKLYSITTNASNVGRVVTVDRITGAVASVGSFTHTILNSVSYAFDFNPVPDRIRLFGGDGSNRRFNPNDGSLSGTDTPPAFATGDVNFGDPMEITHCAYTKSVPGTPNTTLFAIDYAQDLLVKIGGTNGSPSPNGGVTTTVGNLGVAAAKAGGFDIEPVTNTAYAALVVNGIAKLYTVDTLTGAVSAIANIGNGSSVDGLTIVPCSAPPACSPVVYAYNSANNHLISFNAATPGTILTDIALTGLNSGERLLGIDFRPLDGQLYSMTTNTSDVGRVVTINRTTGTVASVGTATHTIINSLSYAFDFNPVPDRIRLFADNNTSRRFNPNDGTLSGTDTPPSYATGDPNFGNTPSISQCAYTKTVAGTPNTTLFAIDNARNQFIRIGGINGVPTPNAGATSTIGALGVTISSSKGGLDIEPTSNTAYAVLAVDGVSKLYTIDTLTGAATLIGTVGGGNIVDGMALLSCSAPVCASPASRIYVDANVAVSGTGSSWSCAMKELSAAITMANATPAIKSIWVADGVYKPTTGTDRTISMTTLRADLKILGGFSGGEANEADANPAINATIISGDIGVANDMTDNSYRLLNIGGRDANPNGLVIDGFIFEKANADAPGDGDRSVGPAIHSYLVSTSTPVNIRRTIFRNNYGRATGAIFLHATNATFDNCRFVGNTTNGSGGGVLVYQASPVFNSCVFAANTATNSGGGFYGNYGTASFSKTTFSGNSAGTGGGIYANRYTTSVANSVFNANTSVSGGGGMFIHNGSNSTVTNSTFFKNTAASSGGAIVLVEANSSINAANNIFYMNMANGMATGAGSDITNFTGGANVYANNILQMNSSVPADNGGAIRNNTRGTDPMFVNEMNAIGADMMWNTADDGLALSGMSAAKNTGDNALAPAGTDFTNSPRIVCSIVDKGAYENQDPCGGVAELEAFVINPKAANATGVVANPFNNDLQIRYMGTEKAGVSVASLSGKTMFTAGTIKQGITRVDASNWSTGLYEVMITTASGKRINFKVVKL